MDRAVAWAARRTDGEMATLWVIEGVATYGAHLASVAKRAGFEVVEAARMDARAHRGAGKSDPSMPAGSQPQSCPLSLSNCAGHAATTVSERHCGFLSLLVNT